MARQRAELTGRQSVLDALSWDGGRPELTVVRGAHGSGKSAVLACAAGRMRDRGILVLEVTGAADRPDWDDFGVGPVLAAVRDRFEQIGTDPRVVEAITVASRRCTEDAYSTAWQRSGLSHALLELFCSLRANRVVALVFDDAELVPRSLSTLAAAYRGGLFVLASTTAGTAEASGELENLAHRVVGLADLPSEIVDELLKQVSNVPADETVKRTLHHALGALYGNPGTLLSTMADLFEKDRLVVLGGRLCLRDPAEPIALPAGHELSESVAAQGALGRTLVLLAAGDVGLSVDDLPVVAAATGRTPLDYGFVVDRLVAEGVLDGEPNGRLRCRCPALATTVVRAADPGQARGLHRAIAACLLKASALDARARSVLAGHVAAAGTSLPACRELVGLLRDDENRLIPIDAARQADYRYAAWWHAGDGPEAAGLASELVRLLVRTAEYARLAGFVAEVVERAESAFSQPERTQLGAAAALAAIHCGQPVPVHVAAALAADDPATGPLALAARWFADEPITPEEIAEAFEPTWLRLWSTTPSIAGRGRNPEQPVTAIEVACAHRDLVPVFGYVLGSDYRPPSTGPLALPHRVFRGYTTGDWTDALSAARELEFEDRVGDAVRWRARLQAAELSGWCGEDKQARAWLESVPEDGPFPALRAWVAAGLSWHAGETDAAVREGLAQYRKHARHADEPGAARLLVRLATIAVETGQDEQARAVLDAISTRYAGRRRTDQLTESALLVRGMVEADPVAIRAAERMTRRRGNRLDMVLTCQLVGRFAHEPKPWLQEAHALAEEVGAVRLVARTRWSLKAGGIDVAPLARTLGPALTPTERRIIDLIKRGKTNRQIALDLRVSAKTVEKHLTRLFLKAGCRTRHGLAMSGLGEDAESIGA